MTRGEHSSLIAVVVWIALAAVHIAGYFYPNGLTWGFHFLGFHTPLLLALYLIIALSAIALTWRGTLEAPLRKVSDFMERRPALFLLAIAFLFLVSCFVFRVKVPLLGDSFNIIKNYAEAARHQTPVYPNKEPLAVYFFYFIMMLRGTPNYASLLEAFFTSELALGLIFICASFFLVRRLCDDPIWRLLAFLYLLSLPYMQFFFGYIENYSLALTLLSVYALFAVLHQEGKVPLYVVSAIFTIMFTAHFVTIFTGLSLVYLFVIEYRRSGIKQTALAISVPLLIGAAAVLAADFDFQKLVTESPHGHTLSVTQPTDYFEATSQAYTLFSPYHLIDIINYAVLMSAGSALLLGLALRGGIRSLWLSPRLRLLALAVAPVLAFLLVAKLELGFARDWDVFGAYFFLMAAMAVSAFRLAGGTIRVLALTVIMTALHAAVMIYHNSTGKPSIDRSNALIDERTFTRGAVHDAMLGLSLYYHQVGEDTAAITLWRRYVRMYPGDGGDTSVLPTI